MSKEQFNRLADVFGKLSREDTWNSATLKISQDNIVEMIHYLCCRIGGEKKFVAALKQAAVLKLCGIEHSPENLYDFQKDVFARWGALDRQRGPCALYLGNKKGEGLKPCLDELNSRRSSAEKFTCKAMAFLATFSKNLDPQFIWTQEAVGRWGIAVFQDSTEDEDIEVEFDLSMSPRVDPTGPSNDPSDPTNSIIQSQGAIEKKCVHQFCEFLSDFGRSEPFLIDGDSLLLFALSNSCLDWRNGGQYLHLIYIVEQFLRDLHACGSQFEIFFLLGNRSLFKELGPSFHLAREMLVLHCRYVESLTHFPLKVHSLPGSWLSATIMSSGPWYDFVAEFRPAFIMCNHEQMSRNLVSIAQCLFFHQLLVNGFYVVALEGITFEGPRVKGFLYDYLFPDRRRLVVLEMEEIRIKIKDEYPAFAALLSNTDSAKHPELPKYGGIVSMKCLFIKALHEIFVNDSSPLTGSFAAVACASFQMSENQPLMDRVFRLPGDFEGISALQAWSGSTVVSEAFRAFRDRLQTNLAVILEDSVSFPKETGLVFVADCFDGRLFTALFLQSVASGALPSGLTESVKDLLLSACPEKFGELSTLEKLLIPLNPDAEAARANINAVATALDQLHVDHQIGLFPFQSRFISGVIDDFASPMEISRSSDPLLPFPSLKGAYFPHHYHSTQPLQNEPDSFSYNFKEESAHVKLETFWDKRRRLKALQLKARAAVKYEKSLLVGNPCEHVHISNMLTPEEIAERKENALKRLVPGVSLRRPINGEQDESLNMAGANPGRRSGKVSARERIREQNNIRRENEREEKFRGIFENLKDQFKGEKVDSYLAKMEDFNSEWNSLVVRMHCLEFATKHCESRSKQKSVFIILQDILRQHFHSLTSMDKEMLANEARRVGFDDMSQALLASIESRPAAAASQRKNSSRSNSSRSSTSSVKFQLQVVPEHLARPKGVGKDSRVNFLPDKWQLELLDIVDSGSSALVIAPTASGKTFVSYYVMEQCLRAGDQCVVVYVAPTKALVNQVRAEVEARFSKTYSGNQKMVAIFTRDYRDEDILRAQILVTVPACFSILLLSNAEWSGRIRHVIFDEVHCLGDPGGEVWEQLLLLVDCPFLALSATLGNADRFHAWLEKVHATRDQKVYLVQHNERFNDLEYLQWAHKDCTLVPVHPCWVLQGVQSGRQLTIETFPHGVRMLPEHCVQLYDSMVDYLSKEEAHRLNPEVFLSGECPGTALWDLSMRHVTTWEQNLKEALCELEQSAQEKVFSILARKTNEVCEVNDAALADVGCYQYAHMHVTSMIQHLKESKKLPCICFMLSRTGCEKLARKLTEDFEHQESIKRETNGWKVKWQRLNNAYVEAEEMYEKCKTKPEKTSEGVIHDEKEELYMKCCELLNNMLRHEEPDEEFTVIRPTEDEIEEAFGLRGDWDWTDYLIGERSILRSALRRGIGVHHAGMPLKYRQAVERLFRAKRLGVIFATATLALGINMPAKTSVFIGDAVYLNGMNFRQMAGRAGRRGFDLRGHVVFMGMPSAKCFRLLRSDLPMLQGNLVLNNSMALRLIMRQSALSKLTSRREELWTRGIQACRRLVYLPLFDPLAVTTLSSTSLIGKQLVHVFRFSIELLLRKGLLKVDPSGEIAPNDLSAFVAHLFFMEPSNFAFVSLLLADEGKVFKRLCRPHPDREEKVLSILCHIFHRKKIPKMYCQRQHIRTSTSGPSITFLPELSSIGNLSVCPISKARMREGNVVLRVLQESNAESLRLLESYCSCFVEAYSTTLGIDNVLPASGISVGGSFPSKLDLDADLGLLALRPKIRSAFVALSGHGDTFRSVKELCSTLRAGVYLDPKMVPIFEPYDAAVHLNAFLLDFYKHGQLVALVRDNYVNQDDAFEELHSFSLVLKALHAAMARRALQASQEGTDTPFSDSNVIETLNNLSLRFSDLLRKASA